MEIPLSRPDITQAEIDAVVSVLHTPNLSMGPVVVEFERAFASYCRTKHAVTCSSGTAALHLLWHALGLKPGDEVVTTPFSFIASSNSIMFEGANPVFADVDPGTWNVDPGRIEAAVTPHTKAILPVHVFGQMADMAAIMEIAERHDLCVFEDSCEALGGTYRGEMAGSVARAGTFGFYPNKQMTTGEGGMIVTDDDALADLTRSLRNQGRDPSAGWLAHTRLGFNYRLGDINSAIGLVQIRRIDEILAARKNVADMYCRRLADEKRIVLQAGHPDVKMSWFVFVVRLDDAYTQQDRDRILTRLQAAGVGCSNYFTPIHLQPFYRERFGYKPGDFPHCEALASRTLALPFHGKLSESEVDYVCEKLTGLL